MLQIINDALKFYRANLSIICSVFLPVYIPVVIITLYMDRIIINDNSGMVVQFFPIVASTIAFYIYTAGLIYLFESMLLGSVLSPKECLLKGLISFPLFLFTKFLFGLFFILGLFLLIVPGIIIAARLSLAQYYVLLSPDNPVEAIKHSFTKTKGYAGLVISTILIASIPLIFFIILALISESVSSFFLNFASGFFGGLVIDVFLEFYFIFYLIILFRIFCLLNHSNNEQDNSVELDSE